MPVLLIVAVGLAGTILAILGRPTGAALVWLVPVAIGAGWMTVQGHAITPLAMVSCWAVVATLLTMPGGAR